MERIKLNNFFLNKKAFVNISTFSLILILLIILMIFSFGFYSYSKQSLLDEKLKLEITNSVLTFRSDLLNILTKENSSINYKNIYDPQAIIISVEEKTIKGEVYFKNSYQTLNFTTLGFSFCSNYSFSPVIGKNFTFNGSCVSSN